MSSDNDKNQDQFYNQKETKMGVLYGQVLPQKDIDSILDDVELAKADHEGTDADQEEKDTDALPDSWSNDPQE